MDMARRMPQVEASVGEASTSLVFRVLDEPSAGDMQKLAAFGEAEDVVDFIGPDEKEFIESSRMFFLTTVSHSGQPTVSYKGGQPGFVSVQNETSLLFPSYDGNGMYYSTGNLDQNSKVGLLFIDFATPNRLRIHGDATIVFDDTLQYLLAVNTVIVSSIACTSYFIWI